MNYTVVADTHLGETDAVRLTELSRLLTSTEEPVIWLGDAFDTLRHSDAYDKYKHLMKEKDIWISGNHDYAQSQTRSTWVGDVFLTHGDMIDFGLLFARLQYLRSNSQERSKAKWLERLVCAMREWTLDDVYNLYVTLYSLSDKDVEAFKDSSFKFKLSTVLSYSRVLLKLLRTPTSIPTVLNDVPYPDGEKMAGYVTHDPQKLLKLVLYFYPEAKYASTIIVGHTHHPIDEVIQVEDKSYRFVTLGAWIGNVSATYARIKEDKVEVIRI